MTSPLHGRGAVSSPPNRFERFRYERDPEADPDEEIGPKTVLMRDSTRTAMAHNDSPDVGFSYSVNPYRGCEHGCSYCYARPTHEYLGFSAGLDFETKILVKEDAPELLRKELSSPRWEPQTVAISGVTDAYQPIERKLRITRRCLEVFAEFRNPVAIVTKNELVARDADLLSELARYGAAAVFVSVTTLDAELARKLEPRASAPERRLAAIEALAKAGVPVGVLVAPVIPAITDHEMPRILEAVARAGASTAGYVVLRLPGAVADVFSAWLEEHFPDRKEKVLGRVRDLRGGVLYDPRWGIRQVGTGAIADEIGQLFTIARRKAGLSERSFELSAAAFRRPERTPQLSLF